MSVIKKILNVISEATEKTTPVDGDYVELYDSTAVKEPHKLSWTNIKATLKTYFDTLYPSGSGTSTGTNTGDQTLPVKASGAELDTGTDDAKFATAKALKDSHNVPSVAPGTSGNVLTSNGTDWTSATPSGGGFDPTTTFEIMEDFASNGVVTSGEIGTLGWKLAGNSPAVDTSPSGKVGIMDVRSPYLSTGGSCIYLSQIDIKGNQSGLTFITQLFPSQVVGSNNYRRIGFSNNASSTGERSDFIGFRSIGTGNWCAVTIASSTETATDTGITNTLNTSHQFKIVSTGTSIGFYIDGVLKATHTTNIPTINIFPTIQAEITSASGQSGMSVDYFYLKITGLTR